MQRCALVSVGSVLLELQCVVVCNFSVVDVGGVCCDVNAFYVLFDMCWCNFLVCLYVYLLLNAVCFLSLST